MNKKDPQASKYYDYIVVGSGIAGLLSAINASKKGSVALLTKKGLEMSNTYLAQGGIAAVVLKSDNVNKHIADTLKSGHNHNNRKAVEYIIKKGPNAIQRLSRLGVNFTKNSSGDYELKLEGGHSDKRIIQGKDTTGKTIVDALIPHIKSNKRIHHIENIFVKDFLIKGGICYGVQCIYKTSFCNIFAEKIILATGGIGQVYAKTTNPKTATADGIAMTKRAGCKIKDPEFIQFHPTALDKGKNPLFLLSETLRGAGATLVNKNFEQFMSKYDPANDLASRDIVSRAIFKESKKGKIYLDMRNLKKTLLVNQFPAIYKKLLSYNINPLTDPAPITPAAHYSCGGVQTDLSNQTSVKNLYAIGEVACNGLHGANRLASNSLLEGAVMSEIIPSLTGKKTSHPNFSVKKYKKQPSTQKIRKQIQKIMSEKLGIIRKTKEMQSALKELIFLKTKLPPSTDKESSETQNLLTTAIIIASAALKRKKSLGCHFREN